MAQLEKAEEALTGYPDDYLGLDLAGIRAHARPVAFGLLWHRLKGLVRE